MDRTIGIHLSPHFIQVILLDEDPAFFFGRRLLSMQDLLQIWRSHDTKVAKPQEFLPLSENASPPSAILH
jgi:hypothetical protein